VLRLEYQILTAVALDLLFGDPRWFPHPVRFIGRLAAALESPLRKGMPNARAAGVLTALLVILVTGGITAVLIFGAVYLNPALGNAVSILILYTSFAAKDLIDHSHEVSVALQRDDLSHARLRVSWMVGRDTENLDETGVVRAAVESVAENTVDGITAPLFFAVVFGPVGVMAYKAVSTLDSTFGYKNERYIDFGRASAKIDDFANYLPARLTMPFIVLAAFIVRLYPGNALRICLRDHKKHASPNSGIPESAMAGALGIQLGGPVTRNGKYTEMPLLGDPISPLTRENIPQVNRLAIATMLLFAIASICIRWLIFLLLKGLK
jgi:adenosylcobinamide-phosphate synthase